MGAATIANSVVGRAKNRASVSEVTAATANGDAETIDVVKAEAAAEALLSKFGDPFAKLESKPKGKKKKTVYVPAIVPHWPGSSASGDLKVARNELATLD